MQKSAEWQQQPVIAKTIRKMAVEATMRN